ncbi:MAG: DNA methyltransferase, partial [Betaproteobacteria bacterium]
MATRKTTPKAPKAAKADLQVETLKHADDTRKNIPTAEFQSVVQREHQQQVQVIYERGAPAGPLQAERNDRNRDLDPQLVWRGKDLADWSDLVVNAPPLYIQEKVHPKVLIDDLKRQSDKAKAASAPEQQGFTADLFADMAKDFNGVPEGDAKTEFYAHDQHWSNRMILGDSLQVMASLAEREGLRGKVQCIYFDPPYGIKFKSNFQWSTTSRDVKDGNPDHITREPEMVKAFRDTWKDGIHSYLSYIRDRLTVARDLLTESGSIFVQISNENVHRVRVVLDEVFGDENCCAEIVFRKTARTSTNLMPTENDFILWYSKDKEKVKFRTQYQRKNISELKSYKYAVSPDTLSARMATPLEKEVEKTLPEGWRLAQLSFAVSGDPGKSEERIYSFRGKSYDCASHRHWKTTNPVGLNRRQIQVRSATRCASNLNLP